MRLALFFNLVFWGFLSSAQQIQPAVQQGHFGDIISLSLNETETILVSQGMDHQEIFWDLKTGMQISRTEFTGERKIKNTTFNFFTPSSVSTGLITINDTTFQFVGPEIRQIVDDKVLRSKSSQYFDQGFTKVIGQNNSPYVFASCFDGNVYVYERKSLSLVSTLKAHLAEVNDILLSMDGTTLFAASSDRTITEWDAKNLTLKRRFMGHSYRINSVLFSLDGQRILFGNELGDLKTFSLDHISHELNTVSISNHPIQQLDEIDTNVVIISSLDNRVYQYDIDKQQQKTFAKYHQISWKQGQQHAIENVLGLYLQSTFYDYYTDLSAGNNRFYIAANEKFNRKRRKIKIINQKGANLTIRSDYSRFRKIVSINDQTFAVLRMPHDFMSAIEDAEVALWKIEGRKKSYAPLEMSGAIDIDHFGHDHLVVLFPGYLKTVDINTGKTQQHSLSFDVQNERLFIRQNLCFISHLNHAISVYQLADDGTPKLLGELSGHEGSITDLDWNEAKKMIVTSSNDATIRFWSSENYSLIGTLIPVGKKDFILVAPTSEYQITKNAFDKFGFSSGNNFIYPDQFDLIYNAPHIVLESLNIGNDATRSILKNAYEKRLSRMPFTPNLSDQMLDLPTLRIEEYEIINQNQLQLSLNASDNHFDLERIVLLVNDVPVLGTEGFSLRDQSQKQWQGTLTVDLLDGANKVEVSAQNVNGLESIRQSLVVEGVQTKLPDLYCITLGASKFEDSQFNLTYAAKDAKDLAQTLNEKDQLYGKVNSLTITDEELTKSALPRCHDFLINAQANDVVVIFFAGHGVLNENYDYFLATYDMDFNSPENQGILYEDLESILDHIRPYRKLLLIDACHSGELDKEEVMAIASNTEQEDGIKFRDAGTGVTKKIQGQSTSELMKEVFTDIRKGTGATVISSAGGLELAMESDQWQNGLFTYCLLNGLQSRKADLNHDKKIMLSELQQFLMNEVASLSNGAQIPTSRIENRSIDFQVW